MFQTTNQISNSSLTWNKAISRWFPYTFTMIPGHYVRSLYFAQIFSHYIISLIFPLYYHFCWLDHHFSYSFQSFMGKSSPFSASSWSGRYMPGVGMPNPGNVETNWRGKRCAQRNFLSNGHWADKYTYTYTHIHIYTYTYIHIFFNSNNSNSNNTYATYIYIYIHSMSTISTICRSPPPKGTPSAYIICISACRRTSRRIRLHITENLIKHYTSPSQTSISWVIFLVEI